MNERVYVIVDCSSVQALLVLELTARSAAAARSLRYRHGSRRICQVALCFCSTVERSPFKSSGWDKTVKNNSTFRSKLQALTYDTFNNQIFHHGNKISYL